MPAIASLYYKDVLWSPSYFAASCGGAPLLVIKQYVEQQNRPLSQPKSHALYPRPELIGSKHTHSRHRVSDHAGIEL